MKLLKQGIKGALVLVLSVGLFACSSGGGDDGGGSPTLRTGVLLDAPISGVHFRTATQNDGTSGAGEFHYFEGETVTFSIGSILFPSVPGASVVTPLDMVGTTDVTDQTVINILRLFQTLDDDPTDDIITISDAVVAAATEPVDFSLDDAAFETSVAAFLSAVPGSPILISSEDAQENFENALLQKMAGNYGGTFSGDGTGKWTITIDVAGDITGFAKDNTAPENEQLDRLSGVVQGDGSFVINVVNGVTTLNGVVTLTGEISGTWADSDDGSNGTFSGNKALPFNAATVPGVYNVVGDDEPGTHVFTFNADNTGMVDWSDDPVDQNLTWFVDAQGVLFFDLANNVEGTLDDKIFLLSGSINNGRLIGMVDDNEDGLFDAMPTASITRQSAPDTGDNGGGGSAVFACNFESGWNDEADEPAVFNSFTDFEAVVAACGGAVAKTDAEIVGTWEATFNEPDGTVEVERSVFNADHTGAFSDFLDGVPTGSATFTWTRMSNNLIKITGSGVDDTGANVNFFDIVAFTVSGPVKVYTEQTNWSSSPNLATLDGVKEGEVWTFSAIKQ